MPEETLVDIYLVICEEPELTDDLRHFELPRGPRHSIHGIGATDADGKHTQTAGVRCM